MDCCACGMALHLATSSTHACPRYDPSLAQSKRDALVNAPTGSGKTLR